MHSMKAWKWCVFIVLLVSNFGSFFCPESCRVDNHSRNLYLLSYTPAACCICGITTAKIQIFLVSDMKAYGRVELLICIALYVYV